MLRCCLPVSIRSWCSIDMTVSIWRVGYSPISVRSRRCRLRFCCCVNIITLIMEGCRYFINVLRVDGFGNGKYLGPSNFLVVSFGFAVVSPGLVTVGVVFPGVDFSGVVCPGIVGFVS